MKDESDILFLILLVSFQPGSMSSYCATQPISGQSVSSATHLSGN